MSVPRVLPRDFHPVFERGPDQKVSTLRSVVKRSVWWKLVDLWCHLKLSKLLLVGGSWGG